MTRAEEIDRLLDQLSREAIAIQTARRNRVRRGSMLKASAQKRLDRIFDERDQLEDELAQRAGAASAEPLRRNR